MSKGDSMENRCLPNRARLFAGALSIVVPSGARPMMLFYRTHPGFERLKYCVTCKRRPTIQTSVPASYEVDTSNEHEGSLTGRYLL